MTRHLQTRLFDFIMPTDISQRSALTFFLSRSNAALDTSIQRQLNVANVKASSMREEKEILIKSCLIQ